MINMSRRKETVDQQTTDVLMPVNRYRKYLLYSWLIGGIMGMSATIVGVYTDWYAVIMSSAFQVLFLTPPFIGYILITITAVWIYLNHWWDHRHLKPTKVKQ